MDLTWNHYTPEQLTVPLLYDLLKLRSDVFIVEQQCLCLDADGQDLLPNFVHLLGNDKDGQLMAYARIYETGNVHIGRVLVHESARKHGVGAVLMAKAVALANHLWPGKEVEVSAQVQVQKFYEKVGFVLVPNAKVYLDVGIEHIDMTYQATP